MAGIAHQKLFLDSGWIGASAELIAILCGPQQTGSSAIKATFS